MELQNGTSGGRGMRQLSDPGSSAWRGGKMLYGMKARCPVL